jgi:hypothetical protein
MRRLALSSLVAVLLLVDLSAVVELVRMWTVAAPSQNASAWWLPLKLLATAFAGGWVWLTVVVGKAAFGGRAAPPNDSSEPVSPPYL